MFSAPSTTVSAAMRASLPCLLLVLLIKLGAYALDPTPRVFLGDSGSYLHTALTGWIPPDRSFLYGWLIAATALPAASIQVLIQLQSAFGIMSAMLLYFWLTLGLRSDIRLAIAAAAALALDPAQLFYERMMMAEATGFVVFVLFFISLSCYVARGGWHWIAIYAALGALAVALRLSQMPVVLVLSLIGPGIRWIARSGQHRSVIGGLLRLALSTAVAVACTSYAHDYYKRWYGEVAGIDPAYTAAAGKFRLGLVAPLVRAEHFEESGVSAELLDQLEFDHRNLLEREAQLWQPGGLWDLLERSTPDAETAARKISIKAARDQPLGLVCLGLETTLGYFQPAVYLHRLMDDLGERGPGPALREKLRTHLSHEAGSIHRTPTPVYRWFAWGSLWLTACLFLLAPLALLVLWLGWKQPARGLRLTLAFASLGLVAQQVLFSHIVSFRYLQPLPWFMLANLALLLPLLRARLAATSVAGAKHPMP